MNAASKQAKQQAAAGWMEKEEEEGYLALDSQRFLLLGCAKGEEREKRRGRAFLVHGRKRSFQARERKDWGERKEGRRLQLLSLLSSGIERERKEPFFFPSPLLPLHLNVDLKRIASLPASLSACMVEVGGVYPSSSLIVSCRDLRTEASKEARKKRGLEKKRDSSPSLPPFASFETKHPLSISAFPPLPRSRLISSEVVA